MTWWMLKKHALIFDPVFVKLEDTMKHERYLEKKYVILFLTQLLMTTVHRLELSVASFFEVVDM